MSYLGKQWATLIVKPLSIQNSVGLYELTSIFELNVGMELMQAADVNSWSSSQKKAVYIFQNKKRVKDQSLSQRSCGNDWLSSTMLGACCHRARKTGCISTYSIQSSSPLDPRWSQHIHKTIFCACFLM